MEQVCMKSFQFAVTCSMWSDWNKIITNQITVKYPKWLCIANEFSGKSTRNTRWLHPKMPVTKKVQLEFCTAVILAAWGAEFTGRLTAATISKSKKWGKSKPIPLTGVSHLPQKAHQFTCQVYYSFGKLPPALRIPVCRTDASLTVQEG